MQSGINSWTDFILHSDYKMMKEALKNCDITGSGTESKHISTYKKNYKKSHVKGFSANFDNEKGLFP